MRPEDEVSPGIEDHRVSLLDLDCHCRSLFTIGACGMDHLITKLEPKHFRWNEALKQLQRAREQSPISILNKLHLLSKNLTTYFSRYYNKRINKLRETLPYIPCKMHIYTGYEISECLTQRYEITKQRLNIAFVGDSLVRSLLEQMIMHLRVTLNLSSTGDSGLDLNSDFLDHKVKHMFPIEGNNIKLQRYWSAELGRNTSKNKETVLYQGAMDILQDWAGKVSEPKKRNSIPDIIYFDEGMWSVKTRPELDALRTVISDYKKLFGTFKKLSSSSLLLQRTLTPVKTYIVRNIEPTSALDLMNQISWAKLNKSGVVIWDTSTPVYLKELDECASFWKITRNASDLPKEWGCADFMHYSRMAEAPAANMLWNLVCNRLMNFTQPYCCSQP